MTRRIAWPAAALVLLASAAASSHASAALITFNDLGPSTGGTHMPDAYAGLRWTTSDWHYMTLASNPADTFLALSGVGTFVLSPIGGADFFLDGADFWSRRAADANGDFYFVLYHDGATVYNGLTADGGRQRFDNVHQTFVPDYSGPIDGFAIAFDNDDWDHLAMDNLQVRFVPSPGSLALAASAALLATRRRR
jgi:hypothetical protein